MIEPLLQAERLLTVGLLDQAEQLYERIAEQDPVNAIARTGLARVALERGDEVAAYRHARRAVELDPENGVALRLEARLSEVLAGRGDIVARPAEGLERHPADAARPRQAGGPDQGGSGGRQVEAADQPDASGVRRSLTRLRRLFGR